MNYYYGIKLTRRAIFMSGLLICSAVETVRNYRRIKKVNKLINTGLDEQMEIQRLTDEAMRSIEEIDRLKAKRAEKEIDDIEQKIEEIRRKIEELGN